MPVPACFEGLCSASVVLLYPHLRPCPQSSLVRYSSLAPGAGGSMGAGGKQTRTSSSSTNSLPTGLGEEAQGVMDG